MLASPVRARSPHFVVHHLGSPPAWALKRPTGALVNEISTDTAPTRVQSVDISGRRSIRWLGLVVPKRHAKRAVTRNLLKRQMREAVRERREDLPGGQWLIRLKAGFDRHEFSSAASDALRRSARRELADVVDRALKR